MVFGSLRSDYFYPWCVWCEYPARLPSILSSWFNLNKQLFGFCNCYQIVGWHFVLLNLCKHLANLVPSEGIPRNLILTMSWGLQVLVEVHNTTHWPNQYGKHWKEICCVWPPIWRTSSFQTLSGKILAKHLETGIYGALSSSSLCLPSLFQGLPPKIGRRFLLLSLQHYLLEL